MPGRQTVQRAYTMKLRPLPGGDSSHWYEALELTHNMFNEAVRFWTDLLLTVCGGLGTEDIRTDGGNTKDDDRQHKVLLTLSWLRVESKDPHNENYRVPAEALEETLLRILSCRGVEGEEAHQWLNECREILRSPIREEACWVDRARKFDELFVDFHGDEGRQAVRDVLQFFRLASSYWEMDEVDQRRDSTAYIQPARSLISNRLGRGTGRDFNRITTSKEKIASWAESQSGNPEPQQLRHSLAQWMGWPNEEEGFLAALRRDAGSNGPRPASIRMLESLARGEPVDLNRLARACRAEAAKDRAKIGRKGAEGPKGWLHRLWISNPQRPRCPERIDFNAPALAEAAIRVFSNWSWIKRSIREREQAASNRRLIEDVPQEARQFLDVYCSERTLESLAASKYRIRQRAIAGWEEVVRAWSASQCRSPEDRRAAVARLQEEAGSEEKFGDARLFTDLAADSALCVWRRGSQPDPQILNHYVRAREAEALYRERKVPMFRHVDPQRHPAFVQFGKSRPRVSYNLPGETSEGSGIVELELVDPNSPDRLRSFRFRWLSKRIRRELFAAAAAETQGARSQVPRIHRLALAAAGHPEGQLPVVRLFQGREQWNGRLQFPRVTWASDGVRREWILTLSAQLDPLLTRVPAAGRGKRGQAESGQRGSQAGLLYSRRPEGLRILGVDLGQRYAAACAVWQTLSRESVERECRLRGVSPPSEHDLYVVIPDECGRQRVYRRIAGDRLPDGDAPHPSPWARLERSFLIRLPGEDWPARPIQKGKKEEVARFAERLGFTPLRQRRIDEQMRHCLREGRLYLRRVGELAKLSWDIRHGQWKEAGRRWLWLMRGNSPLARWCAEAWRNATGAPAPETEPSGRLGRDAAGEAAQILESALNRMRPEWASKIAARWQEEYAVARDMVRWLRRWVAPQGRRGRDNRSVGGVSMLRINNLTDLYRLEKAWATLPQPVDPTSRTVPAEFCAKILRIRDELRQTRVRLIASRILEAAVGIGREPRREKGKPAPARAAMPPEDPRHAPCHVIAIENLSGYGTSETRLRRENRMLMNWSKNRILSRLREGAELLGLQCEEVVASYTSRQDSRTGCPGLRGQMVEAGRLRGSEEWKKRVRRASEDSDSPVNGYIVRLDNLLPRLPRSSMVFVPDPGGEIFMPAQADSPAAGGIQADINAAANVGLRLVLDPDWPGSWWRLPVHRSTGQPDTGDRLKGCRAPGLSQLKVPPISAANGIVYIWRDPSSRPLHQGQWLHSADYWRAVEQRVLERMLRELAPE